MGIPYPAVYHPNQNPYQAGGVPIQQTIFRDTPAPFNCVYCGSSGYNNGPRDTVWDFSCCCFVIEIDNRL
ncbi:hypothetical protein PVL29_018168 [Vitis rotundifolia]|uniref:LITAF domain-containing protein n=1 Tax=Vitis rotundifolia TaxID=103349 RepID=A0AA38Z4B5_VITRO|nr:hypothetical protein PVL29_018168 [Vitis rotundifolia]